MTLPPPGAWIGGSHTMTRVCGSLYFFGKPCFFMSSLGYCILFFQAETFYFGLLTLHLLFVKCAFAFYNRGGTIDLFCFDDFLDSSNHGNHLFASGTYGICPPRRSLRWSVNPYIWAVPAFPWHEVLRGGALAPRRLLVCNKSWNVQQVTCWGGRKWRRPLRYAKTLPLPLCQKWGSKGLRWSASS